MRPPDRYSVSPLPSWATVPIDPVPRYVSFAETVGMIWRAVSGRPKKTFREQVMEAKLVERLAEEMEEEAAIQSSGTLDTKRDTRGEGHGATAT
jgi:hypothetical protein